jgi:hypothetical protein
MTRFRLRRPSPAMVVALLALFVAMGGVGYAALKVPKNSVGSAQIKADAVNSSKVKDGSLLAGDFKAGQLPAGERGPQGIQGLKGDKGDACLSSDPSCRGPKGDTGAQGPGTRSFDGQFPVDGGGHVITTINGINLVVRCDAMLNETAVVAQRVDANHNFGGWGFSSPDGGSVSSDAPQKDGNGNDFVIGAAGVNNVQAALNVHSFASGEPIQWTHIEMLGIRGNACNYHVLVIPPS